jgi:L-threonylcarbamoyladenylate synthase
MAAIEAVDPQNPAPSIIRRAAGILKTGGLVAFPTETVYGLGADATNPAAVARIFAAKGRPATNPLIVHCESVERIQRDCVSQWPAAAEMLAKAFWPGPLTLILPKSAKIPDLATAGLPCVGVRIPRNQVALALITAADCPIAAPSANRSNRLSPTLAEHVARDLGDRIEMIIDGGASISGLESTVVDLTGPSPVILRPGPITADEIALVLQLPVEMKSKRVELKSGDLENEPGQAAPGQSVVHYAPKKPLTFWLTRMPDTIELKPLTALLWLGNAPNSMQFSDHALQITDVKQAEARLYAILHQWDQDDCVEEISVVLGDRAGQDYSAMIDRLSRAAAEMK